MSKIIMSGKCHKKHKNKKELTPQEAQDPFVQFGDCAKCGSQVIFTVERVIADVRADFF